MLHLNQCSTTDGHARREGCISPRVGARQACTPRRSTRIMQSRHCQDIANNDSDALGGRRPRRPADTDRHTQSTVENVITPHASISFSSSLQHTPPSPPRLTLAQATRHRVCALPFSRSRGRVRLDAADVHGSNCLYTQSPLCRHGPSSRLFEAGTSVEEVAVGATGTPRQSALLATPSTHQLRRARMMVFQHRVSIATSWQGHHGLAAAAYRRPKRRADDVGRGHAELAFPTPALRLSLSRVRSRAAAHAGVAGAPQTLNICSPAQAGAAPARQPRAAGLLATPCMAHTAP